MALIQLREDVYVLASDVCEVVVDAHNNRIHVRTKGGSSFTLGADYGEGIYATRDRIVAKVNNELKAGAALKATSVQEAA